MNKGIVIGGNATDRAVLEFVSSFSEERIGIQKINVIPFSSAEKFMATTVSR